jgi:hypothetical protein
LIGAVVTKIEIGMAEGIENVENVASAIEMVIGIGNTSKSLVQYLLHGYRAD